MTKPNNQAGAVDKEMQAKIDEAARIAEAKAVFDEARKLLLASASELGARAAAGATSLTELAFLYNDACRRRMATVEDARLFYGAYAEAHNAAIAAKTVLIGNVSYSVTTDKLLDMEEKSIKTPISMFRTFARPAVVAMGLELYSRVQRIASAMDTDKRVGSIYNCMVTVNRKVSDKADAMALADHELDRLTVGDDEIASWISATKAAPKERDFDTRLEALAKEMAKLVKKGEEPTLRPVYDDLCSIIKRRAATPEIKAGPNLAVARIDTGATQH